MPSNLRIEYKALLNTQTVIKVLSYRLSRINITDRLSAISVTCTISQTVMVQVRVVADNLSVMLILGNLSCEVVMCNNMVGIGTHAAHHALSHPAQLRSCEHDMCVTRSAQWS